MNNKKGPYVFITGRNGFIARHLIKQFEDGKNIFSTSHSTINEENCLTLDLEDPGSFNYGKISSEDFIVHLASVSSPDVCVRNNDYAWQINVKGTCYFINNCIKRGARILFFSSDTVYGSNKCTFDENSQCFPVGSYGLMKYEVERNFIGEDRFKIFRLSYVFSKDDKFTRYLVRCIDEKVSAEVLHPFYRNVIYIKDVLDATIQLYTHWNSFPNKIFNICGEELISRKDIANLYKEIVDKRLCIRVIKPDETFLKNRPQSIHLNSRYFTKLMCRKPNTISSAMAIEFKKQGSI